MPIRIMNNTNTKANNNSYLNNDCENDFRNTENSHIS